MAAHHAVGIDLGTTNSAAARVDALGRSAMLATSEGEFFTPSAVWFDDVRIVVGKEAARAALVRPECVACWVKREMGSPLFSRPIRDQRLPPEVIQSCILRKFRTDVLAALDAPAKVVLTVPACFDEPRRKATAEAGTMAGLDVQDIVNEPTAAALAFGEVHGYLRPRGGGAAMNLLVYDLGGGTFDVTLLRIAPGDVRTLATDGDVQLGGHDWDQRLVDLAAEKFRHLHRRDLREDHRGLARLFEAAAETKHALSARARSVLRLTHGGRQLELPVTRRQFEELSADLLQRTAHTTRQVLADGGVTAREVDRVLLVGGSTRMPMVQEMLGNLFGRAADRSVVPEEAVARGAALYCHWLLSGGGPEGATFRVTNVSSHSLGVEGIDLETRRGSNVVLIPRNTPLPASATKEFVTDAPGQRSIVVQVLEGESPQPAQCARIGRAAIRALPEGLPKGAPVQVTFEYGANGRLSVRAVVPGRAESTLLELQRDRPQRPAAIVPQAPPEGTSPDAPAPAAEPQSDWDWLAALGVAPAGGAWPASTTEESEPDVAAPATQDDGSYPLAAAPPPDDSSPYAAATDLAEGHLSESAISPGPQRSDFARRNQPRIARRLLSLAGIIAFGLLGLGAAALVARLLGR